MRAATSGSAVATSTSTRGRPSSSSRTAPPTTYASTPATAVRMRSSIDDRSLGAQRGGSNSADDLVVDRSQPARVLLSEDAVADERHRSPCLLVPELHRECVHRDRSDNGTASARH